MSADKSHQDISSDADIRPPLYPSVDYATLTARRLDGNSVAERLPEVVLEARKLVNDLRNGPYGDRRTGDGDMFWQYRQLQSGEAVNRIDWRKSAKSHHLFVREHERLTPQHVNVWIDLSPSMHYSGETGRDQKVDQALVIAFALIEIASELGNFVAIPNIAPLTRGQNAAEVIAENLMLHLRRCDDLSGFNASLIPPTSGTLVILSDFWEPALNIQSRFKGISTQAEGVLCRILDPLEQSFEFTDRTRFIDSESGQAYLLDDPGAIRDNFQTGAQAHNQQLRQMANMFGWPMINHTTDNRRITALAAIVNAFDSGGLS